MSPADRVQIFQRWMLNKPCDALHRARRLGLSGHWQVLLNIICTSMCVWAGMSGWRGVPARNVQSAFLVEIFHVVALQNFFRWLNFSRSSNDGVELSSSVKNYTFTWDSSTALTKTSLREQWQWANEQYQAHNVEQAVNSTVWHLESSL